MTAKSDYSSSRVDDGQPTQPPDHPAVPASVPADLKKIEADAISFALLSCFGPVKVAYRYFHAQGKTEEDFDACAWDAMLKAVRHAVQLTAREVRDPVWPYVLEGAALATSAPRLPTNEDMDLIYDAVLRAFAERVEIRPDEVEVDPKLNPNFYRALMHTAWLEGVLANDMLAKEPIEAPPIGRPAPGPTNKPELSPQAVPPEGLKEPT